MSLLSSIFFGLKYLIEKSIIHVGVLDFLADSFTVTLGIEAGATSCVSISIRDDTTFEDVEDFTAVLVVDPDTGLQIGDINTTLIVIDDLGKKAVKTYRS